MLTAISTAFHKGGWGMWPILFTSVITIAIIVERSVYLFRASVDKDKLLALLKSQVMSGNVQGAIKVCSGNPTPMTRIVQAGLMKFNKSDEEVQAAMDEATERCVAEVLTVQPGGIRREDELAEGLHRALELRRRGVRMRDLYTHVARHGQGLHRYMELMEGGAEARTLDEVVERLIVFDRKVAYIPANADRTMALEIRHPALLEYLVTVFERLWRLAIPLASPLPSSGIEGISSATQISVRTRACARPAASSVPRKPSSSTPCSARSSAVGPPPPRSETDPPGSETRIA